MKITGLVLSGGESKRMGSDKGMLLKDNRPWVCLMADLFAEQGLNYEVSINASQLHQYKEYFDEEVLIIDSLNIPGPLGGILSAHIAFPENNWLVLACDMIDMDSATLQHILKMETQNQGFDYYVYKNKLFYEPFCGIYTAAGLQQLRDLYHAQDVKHFGLQFIFKSFPTYSCPVGSNEAAFKNYNEL